MLQAVDSLSHAQPQPQPAPEPVTEMHYAYIKGFEDGQFKRELPVTRAQMAAMLARATSPARPDSIGTQGFPDVPAAHWANAYVRFVRQQGLMSGYPDGDFRPEATITRAEMAAVAARLAKLLPGGTVPDDAAGHWAADPVARVVAARIMTGYPEGSFRPDQPLTRAEAVTVLNRVLGRGPLTGITRTSYPDVPATFWAWADIEEASASHRSVRKDTREEDLTEYIDLGTW